MMHHHDRQNIQDAMEEEDEDIIHEAMEEEEENMIETQITSDQPDLSITWTKTNKQKPIAVINGHEYVFRI